MSKVKQQGNAFLGTDNVRSIMMRFAVPAIISLVVNALYNVVDQIFIGWGIGEMGMAATNITFPLNTIATSLSLLFAIGGAANFNLNMGKGDENRASVCVGNSVTGVLVSGVLVGTMVLAFMEPLLYAFGGTPDMMEYALPYTLITAMGLPFMMMSTTFGHLARADGNPKFSMAVMLSGAIFNLIFDPVFLFVFDMGIEGIALATTLGQVLSATVGGFYMLRRFSSIKLRASHLKPDFAVIRRIAAVGMASCFNQLAMTVVQIAQNNTLKHYGGLSVYGSEIPQAAIGAISKITIILFSVVLGFAQGASPIISFNYGAKKFARVREAYLTALTGATVVSVVSFLIYQIFPRQIMMIFGTTEPLFMDFAVRYLKTFMFMAFINGIHAVTSNFFTSIGKAQMGFWISLTRQILLLLPLMLILPAMLGIDGFFFAGPIADACAATLTGAFAFRELRKVKALEMLHPLTPEGEVVEAEA